MTSAARTRCPVCDGAVLDPVLDLAGAPVLCGALWPTAEEARAAPTGTISLVVCEACSMVFNASFDPASVEYGVTYDNSLHFSGTFQAYAEELARRLVDRFDLRGRQVVEIGSGKGEFLTLLCDLGDCRGVGFDPAYEATGDPHPNVTFVAEYFDADGPVRPDLLCARHVLEHLPDPVGVLSGIAASAHGRALSVYVEVPDARAVFGGASLWDVIYPHVGYYGPPALSHLLRRCGFDVLDIGAGFGDQFLYADAALSATDATNGSTAHTGVSPDGAPGIAAIHLLTREFAARYRSARDRWSTRFDELRRQGKHVVLWGAGTKSTAFLNAVPGAEAVAYVVDVNPRKHGRFLPGTGHEVRSPDALVGQLLDAVLVMNPLYEDEIRRDLCRLEVDAPTVGLV